jgi:hypothetical protein
MMQSERGKPKVVKGLKLGTPTFGFTLVWFFLKWILRIYSGKMMVELHKVGFTSFRGRTTKKINIFP